MTRVVVLIDNDLPEQTVQDWREVAQGFATYQQEPVTLALGGTAALSAAVESVAASAGTWRVGAVGPAAAAPADAGDVDELLRARALRRAPAPR